MREPNAIDFWRGLALILIFVDHVPGNVFDRLTMQNVAICDAAELFVFLAGWALALATGGTGTPEPKGRMALRLSARAIEVYRAQIAITALALAMLAAAALWLANPLFLEWHNAGPAFFNPIETTIGWVLMTHQLGYFNILPLYVVLLATAPPLVLLARRSLAAALALSGLVYLLAMVLRVNLPTWPYDGEWFLNPLSWQVLLVSGFAAADLSRRSERFRVVVRRLVPLALLLVAAGAALKLSGWSPDPLSVPEPRLFFLYDKTYLSPIRLVNFFAIVVAFHQVYGLLVPYMGPVARALSALGRNSLAVFSVGSLASLAGQILRFQAGGAILVDAAIVASGLATLLFTAWFVEWRSRSRGSSPPLLS